jgi:hypothetical protein
MYDGSSIGNGAMGTTIWVNGYDGIASHKIKA